MSRKKSSLSLVVVVVVFSLGSLFSFSTQIILITVLASLLAFEIVLGDVLLRRAKRECSLLSLNPLHPACDV